MVVNTHSMLQSTLQLTLLKPWENPANVYTLVLKEQLRFLGLLMARTFKPLDFRHLGSADCNDDCPFETPMSRTPKCWMSSMLTVLTVASTVDGVNAEPSTLKSVDTHWQFAATGHDTGRSAKDTKELLPVCTCYARAISNCF